VLAPGLAGAPRRGGRAARARNWSLALWPRGATEQGAQDLSENCHTQIYACAAKRPGSVVRDAGASRTAPSIRRGRLRARDAVSEPRFGEISRLA
jgi:hypothetical protein